MIDSLNTILPTLKAKTFFILSFSLFFTYFGSYLTINYFREAFKKGATFIKAKKNNEGNDDLIVEWDGLKKFFWPAFILNILAFIFLLFVRNSFPLNMIAMGIFTFTEGVLLGITLITVDENLALKVAILTGIATFFAGTIGLYSHFNFAFLETYLFWGLIGLIIIQFIRIFRSLPTRATKVIVIIGIVIFIGYLLFDFNQLKKLKNIDKFNNWNTALDLSINIYLDIINLFLYLLELLSD